MTRKRLSLPRYTYIGIWNRTTVVAQRYRWDPVHPECLSFDAHSHRTQSPFWFWVSEVNAYEAMNDQYIGPFWLQSTVEHPVVDILRWLIRVMQFPPPTAMFVYHGTSRQNAMRIWQQTQRRSSTCGRRQQQQQQHQQQSFLPMQSLGDFSDEEIALARTRKNIAMCGDHWVYTTRSYLKAKRYACMDSSQNVHYAGGAILRLVVSLPLDPSTIHYIGRMPFPCECERCRQRGQHAVLPWRVDHTNRAFRDVFAPEGTAQLWVDTETLRHPEYLTRSSMLQLDTLWIIPPTPPLPPQQRGRSDVRAYDEPGRYGIHRCGGQELSEST